MGYIKNVKIGNDTHLIEPILYGTCSTAADVAEKVVGLPNFELVEGVRIAVYFNTKNTAANITLNVNSTGAKPVYYSPDREYENTIASTSSAGYPVINGCRYFIYRSGSWRLEEDALSLSKYANDTARGRITFRVNDSTSKYIVINGSDLSYNGLSPGINFVYVSGANTYCSSLSWQGYNGDSTSYTPKIAFSKDTILQKIAAPTVDTDAANKKYVDDKFALALPLSGGTLTGALTLAADPTTNLGAATKQYVDTAVSSVTASIEVVRLI